MYCYHYCYYVWHADLSCLFCSLPHSIDFVYDPGGFEMTECQATFDPKGDGLVTGFGIQQDRETTGRLCLFHVQKWMMKTTSMDTPRLVDAKTHVFL